jgi:hypothetical protein
MTKTKLINKYDGPVEFKKAALALCDVIRKAAKITDEEEVTIVAWNMKDVGFRISEIACWLPTGPKSGGGASWMRSEIDASALILACEEYVLWKMQKPTKALTNEPDWIQEAIERIEATLAEDYPAAVSH